MSEVFVDAERYCVEKTIDGGMGRVWLLSKMDGSPDSVYQSQLAVKTFGASESPAIASELNHWITLNHDNILPLLRIGRLNFQTAALMPRRTGSIGDLLANQGLIRVESAIQVTSQVLSAITYSVENHSLLHLDIKPANVLVRTTAPLHVEVSDWGISRLGASNQVAWLKRLVQGDRNLTQFGAGTLPYMAPERLTGGWSMAATADIYSVGMMLLEMLTGRLPFMADESLIEDIVLGRYFSRLAPMLKDFPRKVVDFCQTCLSPDPGRRPQSAGRAMGLLL